MTLYFGGYTGMILAHSSASIPSGWLACDGTTKLQSQYPELYAAVGSTYNDGTENAGYFRVPLLSSYRTVAGASSTYAAGTRLGSSTHTHNFATSITVNSFSGGSHNHNVNASYGGLDGVQIGSGGGGPGVFIHSVSASTWDATNSLVTGVATGNYGTARGSHTHNVAASNSSNAETGDIHNHYGYVSYPAGNSGNTSYGSHNHNTAVGNSNYSATPVSSFTSYHDVVYIIKT